MTVLSLQRMFVLTCLSLWLAGFVVNGLYRIIPNYESHYLSNLALLLSFVPRSIKTFSSWQTFTLSIYCGARFQQQQPAELDVNVDWQVSSSIIMQTKMDSVVDIGLHRNIHMFMQIFQCKKCQASFLCKKRAIPSETIIHMIKTMQRMQGIIWSMDA